MIRDNIGLRRIVALVLVTAAVGCAYLALRSDDAPASRGRLSGGKCTPTYPDGV